MKKNILHIITSLSGGGAQRVLFRIIESSQKEKHKFEHKILNLSEGGFYEKKFIEMGIEVHNIGIPKGSFSLKYILKIIHKLKKIEYDLIQTWMYHSDFLGGLLAKIFTKKKILWNIRSANLTWKLNRWHTVIIAKACSILSYFIPDQIISNSNKAISYHRDYGYSKKKFTLIFNGFDSETIKAEHNKREKLRKKFGISDNNFVIGNVARWDPQKDQENLIKAFSIISKIENIKLFLLGENINSKNLGLIKLLNKYKINHKKVILHEQTDEVYDLLNIFDLSVISSKGESFPNAIPESMLTELPVVSTNVGDVKSVVNTSTGWICEPENSFDLSEKLKEAYKEFSFNKKKWNNRKYNCRKKIINFFSIKEMIKSYNNTWNEILNNYVFSDNKSFLNYKYNNNKPTLCHIISSMSHGGAQQVLARIIRADKTVNHEIISLLNLGRYGNELANEGYNVLSLNMSKFSLNLFKIFSLYKVIQKKNYSLIQTWMYHADLIGGILGIFLKKKVFWNIRNSNLDSEWSSYLTILIQKICSLISKKVPFKIISCSERAKSIHSDIGYDESKFKVIDNGFNLTDIKSDSNLRKKFRNKFNISENEFLFGMVARWDPQKDFNNLINSIELFYSKNTNCNARFFLAGPNIENNNLKLTKLIKPSIQEKIILLGNLNNVTVFMNGIDCHILSSAGNEGFPNVIGEAMACGLPCISTNVGDVSKLIFDSNWIVPTKSPNELSDKMCEIYNIFQQNFNEFKKIKLHNREHIAKNFDISKTIKLYHECWSI